MAIPPLTGTAQITWAYISTALHTESEGDDDRALTQRGFRYSDFHPESRERANADCGSFWHRARPWLDDIHPDDVGRLFWLTRNHHGTGFWDEIDGPRGKHLTQLAHSYGELAIYLGDDGKLHTM